MIRSDNETPIIYDMNLISVFPRLDRSYYCNGRKPCFRSVYVILKKAGQNSTNFFLGGRSIIWPIVGASMFATNIGAEHLVGLSGDSYRYGLSAGSVELTCAITLGLPVRFCSLIT